MQLKEGASVAIVDDDDQAAEVTSELVAEAGLRPELIRGEVFDDPHRLVDVIRNIAAAAVIDHRLQPHGLANFDGATAAASLFDAGIPAVLVTTFVMDADVSIRRWRYKIPVLLMRGEADGASIARAFDACIGEFQGKYLPERFPRRSLVLIEGIGQESGLSIADATIPGWNSGMAVRFPLDLLKTELRPLVKEGVRFFAQVNIGSRRPEDLYLTDFELAPEPDPDDGLA